MIKFCKKCNCDTERKKNGGCKACWAAYMSKYRAANPDLREYQANYHAKWRDKNQEKLRKDKAEWKASNKEKVRIYHQNRRAIKRAVGGRLSSGLSERLFGLQKGKCACCGEKLGNDYHLDHILPLALGGTNDDSNMQLLRSKCNLQKQAKHPVDFMQQRGFLL